MNDERQETVDDILAEMRRGTKLPGYWRSCDMNKILNFHADRIEAALKRERAEHTCECGEIAVLAIKEAEKPQGNAAALREALESFMVGSCVYPCVESCGYDPIDEICMRCAASPEKDGDCPYEKARKALAAPQRNCDAMPWRKAWDEWRAKHHPQNPQTFNESYEATVAFMEWFTAPASEKGATA